jgi:hypothetical protein
MLYFFLTCHFSIKITSKYAASFIIFKCVSYSVSMFTGFLANENVFNTHFIYDYTNLDL